MHIACDSPSQSQVASQITFSGGPMLAYVGPILAYVGPMLAYRKMLSGYLPFGVRGFSVAIQKFKYLSFFTDHSIPSLLATEQTTLPMFMQLSTK